MLVLFFGQVSQCVLVSVSSRHRRQIFVVVLVGCHLCKFCNMESSSIKNLILKALSIECFGEVYRLFGMLYKLMYMWKSDQFLVLYLVFQFNILCCECYVAV